VEPPTLKKEEDKSKLT